MKNSCVEWIGEIPDDWEVRKIKYFQDQSQNNSFVDGDWIESSDISTEGIRYLTTGNIGDGSFKEQGNGYISKETFDNLNCKYAYPGDLIFSRLNSPYGRTCILPNNYPEYVIAVDNVILRTKENCNFLNFVTQCDLYQNKTEELAKGSTMKRISRTKLGNIKLPLPPKETQQKIASYLDSKCSKIEETIQNQQQVIEKLKAYKQSLITEAVTGKIKIQNGKTCGKYEEYKDSGVEWIGKIPSSWKVQKTSRCIKTVKGFAFSVNDFEDEGIPIVKVSDIKNGYIHLGESFLNENRKNEFQKVLLHTNDIIMTTVGSTPDVINSAVGQLAIVKEDFNNSYLNQNAVKLYSEKENNVYIYYCLRMKAFREHLNLIAHGTANQASISLKDVLAFSIQIPSKEEQKSIADYLDKKCAAIDNAIDQKQKIIEKLTEYKKSLIYECVTGKKEI